MRLIFLFLAALATASWPDGSSHAASTACTPSEGACRAEDGFGEGSDELSWGSCDFEESSCGWSDTSNGHFQWSLEMANISTIPGGDHTTNSPWGHVMYVEGDDPDIFSQAILERTFHQLPAIGCQIRFWYHLHDQSDISSQFTLSLETNTSSSELWQVTKGQTEGWEQASVRIGNRQQIFKLLFTVRPSFIGGQDIMLDDVALSGCGEGDLPAGSDLLSCDFETDGCAWYADHSVGLQWQRAKGRGPSMGHPGPSHDHTTGSGYYMFVATQKGSMPSRTARLVSYPQQGKCISFWYHIYGGSVGSLRFLARRAGEPETVVWLRTGTQGNKWRFADLSFAATDAPTQFIFEVEMDGTDGSVSLDDVAVSSAVNGSCPAERECTFQGSLCGLRPDPATELAWVRTTGRLSGAGGSPGADHTLGTELGYYLSAQLWKHAGGSRVAMATQVNPPTPAHGECWTFWYHMVGRDVGTLTVRLQPTGGRDSRLVLWSRSGDQEDRWRHGRTTVLSPGAAYQIVFEAVSGDGEVRDIAIDDITILDEPCAPQGFCDFEMDMCGWVSSVQGDTGVDWDWDSGTSAGMFAPDVDHTTNTALGHYMSFDTSPTDKGQIAVLQSELMEPVPSACLEFWYHMDMWAFIDHLELAVYVNETGTMRPLWREGQSPENVWRNVTLDFGASEKHRIVFEAKRPPHNTGVIALDDVYIRRDMTCADLSLTTPAPTTVATTPSTIVADCSFEDGLCDWVQDTGDDFDWSLQRGLQSGGAHLGPLYDRTVGNDKGVYLLINTSAGGDNGSAVISVPLTAQTTDVCVGFWYYMLGSSVSNLDLLIETKTSEIVAWTRRGSQVSDWLNAQVTLSMAETLRIKFSGGRHAKGSGFIAVDDVSVTAGACVDQSPCGFESHTLCGFENSITNSIPWLHVNGTTHRDHTYRTQLGHSMAVFGDSLKRPEVTHLLTPEFSTTPSSCLQFWYVLNGSSSASLSVHVVLNGEVGPALWSLSGRTTAEWQAAGVTISAPAKYRVAFRAELSPSEGCVLLDDVSVGSGACTPPGSCDFESGQCTWTNVAHVSSDADAHDWVHADGHYLGPPVDHSTHTAYGRFMLGLSGRARLQSEWIQQTTASCLSLWSHTNSSGSGTLRVFVDSGNTETLLQFQTHDQNHNWTRFSSTLNMTKPFKVLIEADSGGGGFVALDDITVTEGQCEVDNVTRDAFIDCQFETGTCDWADVSVGQFAWERGRNGTATANTGPSVDHTLGTDLGWYMAVEASQGEQNSFAALQSPAMQQASADCVLEFYYHMHGEGIGELKVLLQEGPRLTPLWWLSGDHGDEWRLGQAGVGRTPQVFSVLFEATRTFSELGDIALDDVAFLNCSLPEPQESCSQGMFRCSNRVCVEMSRVCDFTDDCGDGTDEADCGLQGRAQRCSFEQGLCSWQSSGLGGPWTLHRAESTWPKLGPARDHTRNTAAGHYIVPEPHLTEGKVAEITSDTLLPSSDCTVSSARV